MAGAEALAVLSGTKALLAPGARRDYLARHSIGSVASAAFMAYAVKEIFKTLQGEGRNSGRAAVFCRFAGCNLWSGREADRAAAVCQFCDTDFVGMDGSGGGKFESAEELAAAVAEQWGEGADNRLV